MKKNSNENKKSAVNGVKKCNGAWVHMQISGKQLERLSFLEAATGVPIPEILSGGGIR